MVQSDEVVRAQQSTLLCITEYLRRWHGELAVHPGVPSRHLYMDTRDCQVVSERAEIMHLLCLLSFSFVKLLLLWFKANYKLYLGLPRSC